MSGLDLAGRLCVAHPAVKLLCISGYSPDTAAMARARGMELPFLQKPFTSRELCQKVREVLDAGR
jgi:DNA-binding NtrC family response regulator